MLNGLALAETTPGPLIMVLQFIGFIAAYRLSSPLGPWLSAVLGAFITTWVTFLPSFLFVFLGAPYMESLRQQRALNAALTSVTAAVVGVILNLSVWSLLHTAFTRVDSVSYGPFEFDVPVWSTLQPVALALSAAAVLAMLRFKVGMGYTLLASALLGFGSWVIQPTS
jgi:chromate transporter